MAYYHHELINTYNFKKTNLVCKFIRRTKGGNKKKKQRDAYAKKKTTQKTQSDRIERGIHDNTTTSNTFEVGKIC